MAKTDTIWNENFPGIIIKNDESANPTFALTVKEQLDKIASKPLGRLMLRRISDRVVTSIMPFKVCIVRAASTRQSVADDKGMKWHGGNVTEGTKMNLAYGGGGGTPSVIKYNPNIYVVPDGARPPYIGLAHELVHAYQNIHGTTLKYPADELKTTGLGAYAGEEISENTIRGEHGLPPRETYEGLG